VEGNLSRRDLTAGGETEPPSSAIWRRSAVTVLLGTEMTARANETPMPGSATL